MTRPEAPAAESVPASPPERPEPFAGGAPLGLVPGPIPPQRARRIGLVAAGVVTLVLALAAGATAAVLQANRTPLNKAWLASFRTVSTAPSPTTPPSPTEAPPYLGRLQDLAVPMPVGATREPLRMGDADGSLTEQQFLEEYDSPSYRITLATYLDSLGFQRGVFIAWRYHGVTVYLQILQFRHAAGAADWQDNRVQSDSVYPDNIKAADMAEIEGGFLYANKLKNGGVGAHGEFSKGPFNVMIDVFDAPGGTFDAVRELLLEQNRRLP